MKVVSLSLSLSLFSISRQLADCGLLLSLSFFLPGCFCAFVTTIPCPYKFFLSLFFSFFFFFFLLLTVSVVSPVSRLWLGQITNKTAASQIDCISVICWLRRSTRCLRSRRKVVGARDSKKKRQIKTRKIIKRKCLFSLLMSLTGRNETLDRNHDGNLRYRVIIIIKGITTASQCFFCQHITNVLSCTSLVWRSDFPHKSSRVLKKGDETKIFYTLVGTSHSYVGLFIFESHQNRSNRIENSLFFVQTCTAR